MRVVFGKLFLESSRVWVFKSAWKIRGGYGRGKFEESSRVWTEKIECERCVRMEGWVRL